MTRQATASGTDDWDTAAEPLQAMVADINSEANNAVATANALSDSTRTTQEPLEWKAVTEHNLTASVKGFEVRRHTSGRLALYQLAQGEQDEHYIGAAVWLDGMARDGDGQDWCTVVRFIDNDGKAQRWLMPRESLVGERSEALRQLYRRGLDIALNKDARKALDIYLSHKPAARFTTVLATGWHGGSFVLPTRTVGPDDYLLVNGPTRETATGTLDAWRGSIGAACIGNSRLLFAVSTAFASPLLRIAGAESGGVHYVGKSSKGKTTALIAACSVWEAELHQWRATDNGLEGVAARHSDCGLVLDEIGQADGKVAGEMVYMLANGTGKARARRDGSDRPEYRWRLIPLSSGEHTLSEHMSDSGKRTKTGQEIRLVNIESDAGAGMGVFEDTRGEAPAKFAEQIAADAKHQHGTAGPAFIDYIVGREAEVHKVIEHVRERFDTRPDVAGADGQVRRVARRFALIAAAGEIATQAGITGWTQGAAIEDALTCFASWRSSWTPSGSQETHRAIEQVRAFLQTQSARFEAVAGHDDRLPVRDRAGYRDGDDWLVFPSVFRDEIAKGFRTEQVADALDSADYLVIETNGERRVRQVRRRAGGNRSRFYVIRGAVLEGADGEQ